MNINNNFFLYRIIIKKNINNRIELLTIKIKMNINLLDIKIKININININNNIELLHIIIKK